MKIKRFFVVMDNGQCLAREGSYSAGACEAFAWATKLGATKFQAKHGGKVVEVPVLETTDLPNYKFGELHDYQHQMRMIAEDYVN